MPSSTLRSPPRAALTLLLAATVFLVLARPAGAVSWAPCIDTIDDVQCARFVLPADRTGGFAGATSVQVYKAGATEGPRLGTLVVIAGGPGQASFGMLDYMLSLFPGANRYDLVAIDQRGTGLSEPLNCPRIELDVAVGGPDPAHDRPVTECATALGPAHAGYDTAESVADIEAVRAELGVDQISLFGVSYGTKLALAYATTYPARVRSLLLDSVLPVSEPGPFDTASVAAMRGSLDQLCANGHCHGVLASPQTSLRRMIQLLKTEPLIGYLENKNGRQPTKIEIGPSEIFDLLFAADFNLYIYEQLPSAIGATLRGEDAPLLRLFAVLNAGTGNSSARVHRDSTVGRGRRSREQARTRRAKQRAQARRGTRDRLPSAVSEFSSTLNLATGCEDFSAPWTRGAPLDSRQSAIDAAAAALPDSTFLPFDRDTVKNDSLATVCRGWQESADTPVLPGGPLPPVPVLALNGSLDVRTPVTWAKQAIEGDPLAQLVTVPYTGHSTIGTDISGCALSLAKRFLIFGGTDGKCKSNPRRLPVAGPALVSVNQVKALRGRCHGLRGRQCTGAKRSVTVGYLAFRDALDQLVVGGMTDGPGLYSGGWELTEDTTDSTLLSDNPPAVLALEGLEQVPGVIVDGRVEVTDYPRVSGSFTVLTPTGRSYDVNISGRVAYDQRGDHVRLSAHSRRVRVLLSRGGRKSTRLSQASADALRTRSAFARAAGTRRIVR